MNCVCDFSVSHYFAELDSMHMPLILVAECLQRALRRTGCGVFLRIVTQQLLEVPRVSPFVFPTSLCGKIAFFVLQRVLVRLNGDSHKEMICVWLVQREGPAPRGRLTLRLLNSQHTAAIADHLMVFTATIRHTIFPWCRRNSP